MQDSILFSIVVVCYNAGEKLEETLQSIVNQTETDYEIVIKDGLSTDSSINLAKLKYQSDERIRIFEEKDAGIYDAMNQAVDLMRGEYVIFLNCGDYFYDETVLEKLEKVIVDHKNPLLLYGDTFDKARNALVPIPLQITAFTCYRHIPCHQAIVYHKSLFDRRAYLTQYRIRADYDHFLWCFFKENVKPLHVGFPIALYEGGGYSESKENKERDYLEHEEIIAKYLTKGQIFKYKTIMALTLVSVRRAIGNSPYLSGFYNKLKAVLYRK